MQSEYKRTLLKETPFLHLNEVEYFDHEGVLKKWYGVSRKNSTPAVQVAAITEENELVLVTQYRPYIDSMTIELPAGLMDVPGESVIDCAERELLEETGFQGDGNTLHALGGERGLTVSAGLTDERIHLVIVTGCVKVADPYTNEGTHPFLVPLRDAEEILYPFTSTGKKFNISFGLFGTLYIIRNYLNGGL